MGIRVAKNTLALVNSHQPQVLWLTGPLQRILKQCAHPFSFLIWRFDSTLRNKPDKGALACDKLPQTSLFKTAPFRT